MKTTFKLTPSQSHQGASKNVPNGPANTWKTVETVKKLRDPGATPLKRGVNESRCVGAAGYGFQLTNLKFHLAREKCLLQVMQTLQILP